MLPLFLSFLVFSPFLLGECNSQPLAPALFVFGDSLSDAGNDITENSATNQLPYGVDFPSGPTGRYTNGKTFVDLIAGYLGLPLPQPYHGEVRTETGYVYASAGCGILSETGNIEVGSIKVSLKCMTLDYQIGNFSKTIDEELRPKFSNPSDLSDYLANSIFIVWIGNNDYFVNYFLRQSPSYHTDEEFAQHLVDQLSYKLQSLYKLGGRKFAILELGPLGCVPFFRKIGLHKPTWCDEAKSANAVKFNERLSPMIQILGSTYPDSLFTLGKIYNPMNDAFNNPTKYGFNDVSNPCCNTGLLGISPFCDTQHPKPCAKRDEYAFFDGFHLTEAGNRILATPCFNGSNVCVPYNIQQLAQAHPPLNSANYLSSVV